MRRSGLVLLFCSDGFFQSQGCLRELRATVRHQRPRVVLVEMEEAHGALSVRAAVRQLEEGVGIDTWTDDGSGIAQRHSKWQPAAEQWKQYGFENDGGPTRSEVAEALSASEQIEWNRLAAFQQVTLRLIAERLLPSGHPPLRVPPQSQRHCGRVYCSPRNPGAAELLGVAGFA